MWQIDNNLADNQHHRVSQKKGGPGVSTKKMCLQSFSYLRPFNPQKWTQNTNPPLFVETLYMKAVDS